MRAQIERTMRSARLLLLIASLPLACGLNATPQSNQLQHPREELRQDLAQLNAYLFYRGLNKLEAVVDQTGAKWQKEDRTSFVTYMSRACGLLSSYDIADSSKRASLRSRYAIEVLTSGDLSLRDQIQFAEQFCGSGAVARPAARFSDSSTRF